MSKVTSTSKRLVNGDLPGGGLLMTTFWRRDAVSLARCLVGGWSRTRGPPVLLPCASGALGTSRLMPAGQVSAALPGQPGAAGTLAAATWLQTNPVHVPPGMAGVEGGQQGPGSDPGPQMAGPAPGPGHHLQSQP